MDNEEDIRPPNFFVASATILLPAGLLNKLYTHQWLAVKGGTVVVGVRNMESHKKLRLHMIPSIPAFNDKVVNEVIEKLLTMALISQETSGKIQKTVLILRSKIQQQPENRSGALQGDLDLEATLEWNLSEGEIFIALGVSAEEDGLVRTLTGLPAGSWIAPVSCHVEYRDKGGWGYRSWSLGAISETSEQTIASLDEMTDRKKISSERAAVVSDWLDQLAHKAQSIPNIEIYNA